MEAALRTCCKGIKIGKILVVRHHGQMSRAGTSVASPRTAQGTPVQAAAAAADEADGPFNSPRRNQQWQQFPSLGGGNSSSNSSSQPSSRHASASPAAASASSNGGVSSGSKAAASCVSPRGSPMPPGGFSTEGGAFAAAVATYGSVQGQCWIQNSTQDVIYEKLPADIAERNVLLMDPVLSTGNSAYTAIEVSCSWAQWQIAAVVQGRSGLADSRHHKSGQSPCGAAQPREHLYTVLRHL